MDILVLALLIIGIANWMYVFYYILHPYKYSTYQELILEFEYEIEDLKRAIGEALLPIFRQAQKRFQDMVNR